MVALQIRGAVFYTHCNDATNLGGGSPGRGRTQFGKVQVIQECVNHAHRIALVHIVVRAPGSSNVCGMS